MRVFVTGATGFIGSVVVKDLIEAGHSVLGLTRSDAGARELAAARAEAHRGSLEDVESLRSGAASADAVIHTAFNHDFSRFQQDCDEDRKAIEAMGEVLAGSGKTLIVTSGVALVAQGRPATEDDAPPSLGSGFPRASEHAAAAVEKLGVKSMVIRLPQVHDTEKQGLITYLIQTARQTGVSAYVGDGENRWAAAPRYSAAGLYRLALEKGRSGARYHAVAEEGVRVREIAEAIGRGLKVPVKSLSQEEANAHFGFLGRLVGIDLTASSEKTRKELGWSSSGPALLSDLGNMKFA
ncbi:SDR family oxidoreductase [Occallatibacter savannae]|uniref:SDR family oxidoreductase n=1 Tax=Occallatibacter savannae TaxID=1002691 RepID=UPI000D6947CE|nr:SDR family oxidoreductase [Occallatibacter savannae]